VNARVAEFYEQTSEYEFDVWPEWREGFRPFGNVLAAIFGQCLQQLNVPRSSGRSYGDPGFHLFAEAGQGRGSARYLKVRGKTSVFTSI
jgi:hypothetical protein